ncbi:MAG TPA: hypothetical protein VIF62_30545 [Labilithrix sp.]|jgi:hypothetical protein
MKASTLGAIAIASTMTLACTMTETKTETEPAASNPAPTSEAWRAKLSLAKPKASAALHAFAQKKAPAASSHPLKAGGGGCGLSTGDPTCDTCLDASCCAENTACVSDADCQALLTCGDACTDDACFNACYSAHPSGAAKLDDLSRCVESSCASQCGGGGPPPPSGSTCGFGSGDPTCDSCLDTSCCTDADACLGDADCTALLDCGNACADDACISACEAAHPSGAKLLDTLSTCVTSTCGSACASAGGGPGDGGPGGPPPAGSCGLTSGDATCDTCLNGSCCAPTTTCLGDAECIALIRCYDGCADDACASACDAAHPAATAEANAIFTCVQSSCSAACGL